MIAASRRRRPGVRSVDETFRLHDRLASRSSWSVRLFRGSIAALAGSVLALLVGASVTVHAAILVVGFLVGVALPVLGQRQKALEEIRSRVGLSYETALDVLREGGENGTRGEVDEAPSPTDPYGFRAAVVDRARLAAADVKPPATPAWWLPALAVAAALILVSSLDLIESPGRSGLGGNGGGTGPTAAPVEDLTDQEGDTDSLTPPDEAPGRAEEPEAGAEDRQDDEGESGNNAPPPVDGDGDDAPMSRFLDSLRERPPDAGGGQQGQDQSSQGQPDEETSGQGQPGAGRDGEPERVDLPGGAPDQDSSEPQTAGEAGDDESGEEGAAAVAAGESEDEGDGDTSGEQEGGDAPGQTPGDSQEAENELAEGGGDGEPGLEAGSAADGESGDDPAGQAAAGAGAGPESAAGVADGEAEQPEFLQGVLGDGPESPAGAVRLPGQTDVTLPPGAPSTSDYAAAAEEALSEGDLPLSYQEIIRRYFR